MTKPNKEKKKERNSAFKKIYNGAWNTVMVVAIPVNLLYHFGKFVFSKSFWRR